MKEGFVVNNRWKMFSRYVENHGDEYEQVFICDTRDLIFQGNVFECFHDQKNFLGYTTEADDIKGSRTKLNVNYQWLESFFNKNIAEDFANKDIICCGTVIGTADEMKIFLKKMIEYNPNSHPIGNDQATEQVLIHNNLLPIENLIKIDCWTGAIFTAFAFGVYKPVEIKDDFILRGDGGVPAVVHQYDRNETLIELVDKIYRDLHFEPDERIADKKIAAEYWYYLIQCAKFNKALSFFSEYLLPKLNLSKDHDFLITAWKFLAEKKDFDPFEEGLNAALQATVMSSFKDCLFINQARAVFECLNLCKKNNHTVILGFEDWLKNKLFKAVKWHLDHNNVPRYQGCFSLMIDMNLTDNECFYFLRAEMSRNDGNNYLAADFYSRALDYQNKGVIKRGLLITEYWKNLILDEKVKFPTQ